MKCSNNVLSFCSDIFPLQVITGKEHTFCHLWHNFVKHWKKMRCSFFIVFPLGTMCRVPEMITAEQKKQSVFKWQLSPWSVEKGAVAVSSVVWSLMVWKSSPSALRHEVGWFCVNRVRGIVHRSSRLSSHPPLCHHLHTVQFHPHHSAGSPHRFMETGVGRLLLRWASTTTTSSSLVFLMLRWRWFLPHRPAEVSISSL